MSREASVVRSLVDMADSLVEDFDVVDLLTQLANSCVDVLGFTAAGVMLSAPGGELRLVASSSEAMRIVEMFELQAQEGPCLDAFRSGEPVERTGLLTGDNPWPRFSEAAREAGFQSVLALPLRLREETMGALNLFSAAPADIEETDVVVARGFADLATISIVHHRVATHAQEVNEQLTGALTSRVLIEQAKGVIAERGSLDLAEAFDRLRRYARDNNIHLTAVARSAIDGTLDPRAWGPDTSSAGPLTP